MSAILSHAETPQIKAEKNITLRDIVLIPIIHGGYKIIVDLSFMPSTASRWWIQLWAPSNPSCIANVSITQHPHERSSKLFSFSLINDKSLPGLLREIGQKNLWGMEVNVKFCLFENGIWSYSEPKTMQTPVKPVSKKNYELACDKSLIYPFEVVIDKDGKRKRIPVGRCLFDVDGFPPLPHGFYFVYGKKFETNKNYRGFDCTTFARALLNIASDDQVKEPGPIEKRLIKGELRKVQTSVFNRGERVATKGGMRPILEKKTRSQLQEILLSSKFLDREGLILLTKIGEQDCHHIVWWVKDFIYEFNFPNSGQNLGLTPAGSKGGYCTAVSNWRLADKGNVFTLYVRGRLADYEAGTKSNYA